MNLDIPFKFIAEYTYYFYAFDWFGNIVINLQKIEEIFLVTWAALFARLRAPTCLCA